MASGSTPASGYGNWYWKTDNLPYGKNDAGREILLGCDTGSWIDTLQGLTTTVIDTIGYVKTDQTITLTFKSKSGTSNSTIMRYRNMPSSLRPSTGQKFVIQVYDNTITQAGTVYVYNNAQIEFDLINAGGFTASGLKGLADGTSITYRLD